MLIIIKYGSIILAGAIPLFSLVKEYRHRGKIKPRGWLLVCITILLIVFSLVIQCSSDRESKEAQAVLNTKFTSLERKYDSLQNAIILYTVGQGYCLFSLNGIGNNIYMGFLNNERSKYPAYNIRLVITDAKQLELCKVELDSGIFIYDKCYNNITKEFLVNEVASGVHHVLNAYNFESNEEFKKFEIKLYSRSSRIVQQSIHKLQLGECQQAYRIYDVSTDTPELIETYNGIPELKIDWDKEFLPLTNRRFLFADISGGTPN